MSTNVVSLKRDIDPLIRGKNGAVLNCLSNVRLALNMHTYTENTYRFDTFRQRIQRVRPTPWHPAPGPLDDIDLCEMRLILEQVFSIRCTLETLETCVKSIAHEFRFDSLFEHVCGLAWDGRPRLETWLATYLGVENTAFYSAVGKRFLIGAVARAVSPGCKADSVLVLEGPQGALKSQAVEALGQGFFGDIAIDLSSKDMLQNMQGLWFVELGELDGLQKTEVTAVKRFISQKVDRFRPPYARLPIEAPRRCVFVGTSNDSAYLRDSTGGRRFWPVSVGKIDIDALARDRDAILAEAREAYKKGEKWWLDASECELIAAQTDAVCARTTEHPWADAVARFLTDEKRYASYAREHEMRGVTTTDVLIGAVGFESVRQIDQRHTRQASDILRSLGLKRVRLRTKNSMEWLWVK